MRVLFLLLMIVMASCSTENPLEQIMQSGKKEIAAIIKNQDQHADPNSLYTDSNETV